MKVFYVRITLGDSAIKTKRDTSLVLSELAEGIDPLDFESWEVVPDFNSPVFDGNGNVVGEYGVCEVTS